MNAWQRLSPQQKKIAMALGGAGILALFALLSRGRGAAPQQKTAAVEGDPASAYDWSSVPSIGGGGGVDAGSSDAGWSSVAQGLGDVALGLDNLSQGQQGLVDRIGALEGRPEPTFDLSAINNAVAAAMAANTVAAAPTAAAATPAIAARPVQRTSREAAVARQGALLQTSGTRAGLAYKAVVKDGKFYRFYESKAGRGDFGAKADSKIYVRPASTPSRAPAKAKTPPRKPASRR